MITFKEFKKFANARAADGAWSYLDAICAIKIIEEVQAIPFWKREEYWREHYADLDLSEYET